MCTNLNSPICRTDAPNADLKIMKFYKTKQVATDLVRQMYSFFVLKSPPPQKKKKTRPCDDSFHTRTLRTCCAKNVRCPNSWGFMCILSSSKGQSKAATTFRNLNSQYFSLAILLHVWNLEIYNLFSYDDFRVQFFANTFFETFHIPYNSLPFKFHLDIAIHEK